MTPTDSRALRGMKALSVCLLVSALCACGEKADTRAIEYCIPLEDGSELPVARVLLGFEAYSSDNRPTMEQTDRFLIASEIPITVLSGAGLEEGTVELVHTSLAVLDAQSDAVVGRATFWNVDALRMLLPSLGPAGASSRYDGVIGGDLLRKYSVRLVYAGDSSCAPPWQGEGFAPPTIRFAEALPDTDGELAADGYAVMDYKLAGGGTAMVADRELQYGATRVAVGVCVEPAPYWPDGPPAMTLDCESATALETLIPVTGVDAFGLIATGTGPLLITESFYENLAGRLGPAWPDEETPTTMDLPEGTVDTLQFGLSRIALVGDRYDSRGPCAELAQRRRIDLALRFCPNKVTSMVGKRGASVAELDSEKPTASPVAIPAYRIADSTMLMAGLQAEVATQIPGIDLLIGADLLRHFELWLDYPESRVVMRCMSWVDPVSTSDATGRPVPPCLHAAPGQTCCAGSARRECRCAGSPCCQYYRWSPPK